MPGHEGHGAVGHGAAGSVGPRGGRDAAMYRRETSPARMLQSSSPQPRPCRPPGLACPRRREGHVPAEEARTSRGVAEVAMVEGDMASARLGTTPAIPAVDHPSPPPATGKKTKRAAPPARAPEGCPRPPRLQHAPPTGVLLPHASSTRAGRAYPRRRRLHGQCTLGAR